MEIQEKNNLIRKILIEPISYGSLWIFMQISKKMTETGNDIGFFYELTGFLVIIAFVLLPPLLFVKYSGAKNKILYLIIMPPIVLSFLSLIELGMRGYEWGIYYWIVFGLLLIPRGKENKIFTEIKIFLQDLGHIYLLVYFFTGMVSLIARKSSLPLYITLGLGVLLFLYKKYFVKMKPNENFEIFNKGLYYHYARFFFYVMLIEKYRIMN